MIQLLKHPVFRAHDVTASVLRLDLLHPPVSGNKWFKLKYYLREAQALGKSGIISCGGAYSNHLAALAVACQQHRLRAAAIIRGDAGVDNPLLTELRSLGVTLLFVSRSDYRNREALAQQFIIRHPGYHYVPEGGRGPAGVAGASEIITAAHESFTHVLCSVGTGTTLAGISKSCGSRQQAVGISALKIAPHQQASFREEVAEMNDGSPFDLLFDYHRGGYAHHGDELIAFMNDFYRQEGIPTDFVYTAKLMMAAIDLTQNGFFPRDAKLLIIHSGGLQGNRSLAGGLLDF